MYQQEKKKQEKKDELYNEIVAAIKAGYDNYENNLSSLEAHLAAQNLIEFVKVIINHNQDRT